MAYRRKRRSVSRRGGRRRGFVRSRKTYSRSRRRSRVRAPRIGIRM